MKNSNVICAIDVNDFDPGVVDVAANFAAQFGVGLDLLHVTPFPDPMNAAWPAYVGSPDPVIRDQQRLQEIDTDHLSIAVHRHHLSGAPADKILEFVQQNPPTLLVLGTHGRRGLGRLLGSVAMKVLRRASCPVMVLRQKIGKSDAQTLSVLESAFLNPQPH